MDSEHPAAWSAAGAAVMLLGLGGAIGWFVAVGASSDPHASVPVLPVTALFAVGFVGLYGMVAPLTHWWPWTRTPTSHPSTAPVPVTDTPANEQIDIDLSPADLFGFYNGNTAVQGDALLAPYLGKWMTVSGHFLDLKKERSGYLVTMKEHLFPKTTNNVSFHFDDRWGERLTVLKIRTELTVRGRIDSLHLFLRLGECELL